MPFRASIFILSLWACIAGLYAASPDSAFTELKNVPHTYYVSQSEAPNETRFRTIQEAVDRALVHIKSGDSVLVYIDEGVYRESAHIEIKPEERSNAHLILRASIPSMTTLSGADLWKSNTWKYENKGKVYTRHWGHAYDVAKEPLDNMPWPVRHTAMIFIDGVRLQQSLWPHGMPPGTFHLHKNGNVYFVPPKGMRIVDWDRIAMIEVSNPNRPQLITSRGVNLILQGINFEYAPGRYQEQPAVDIADANNVLIELCEFNWNNDCGLQIDDVTHVTLSRVKCDHNGLQGLRLSNIENFHGNGVRVALNFWRGIEAGAMTDYFPENAAWTMRGVNNAELNQPYIVENRNNGFFADGGTGTWLVEGAFVVANNARGMSFDYMHNLSIRNAHVLYNNGSGLDMVGNVLLSGSTVYRNGLPDIFRVPMGQLYIPATVGTYTLINNIIESDVTEAPVIHVSKGEGLFPTFKASGNIYYSPDESGFSVYGSALDFPTWQALFHTDAKSIYTDPLIITPDESEQVPDPYRVSPDPASPVFERENWETTMPVINEAQRAEMRRQLLKAYE